MFHGNRPNMGPNEFQRMDDSPSLCVVAMGTLHMGCPKFGTPYIMNREHSGEMRYPTFKQHSYMAESFIYNRSIRTGFLWFFPACPVRVVRFYVSCLVLLLLLLLSSPPPLVVLLLSLSSSSSCSTATRDPQCFVSDLNHDHPRPVFPAGPQPRPSTPSVPCRTSTTTIHAQCSLPDLNHDHPRPVFPAGPQPRPSTPVFPAGPQPRPSTPSVPCRTSTTTIHAQCSLPDLM